jgi:penicillin-binding protein 2
MLIFDQLKRNDPQLQLLAVGVLSGLLLLLAGLWWVQVVSARDYQNTLESQSFRTVRIPAARGKIFDRSGTNVLADNRPRYSVNLYLEELRGQFQLKYAQSIPVRVVTNSPVFWKRWMGASNVSTQRVRLSREQLGVLSWQSREQAARLAVQQISRSLQQPLDFDPLEFETHYRQRLAMPYPVITDLSPVQIARFEEQWPLPPGVDLELQPLRFYPHQSAAAHLLGSLKYDDSSKEGEDAEFHYRLPDYRGVIGIEAGFDSELRGHAGAKSVLVNNLGYRQSEDIWSPAQPGRNVVLTVDLAVQRAAEEALPALAMGPDTRGAAVVMEVDTGDVLALASAPSFNPNVFLPKLSLADNKRLTDPHLRPQINRAIQMQYQAGSTFKTIVALALLETPEARFNPNEKYIVAPNPAKPESGIIYIGNQPFHDTVAPGEYDLRRALVRSSNAYFIANGLRKGVFERVVQLGHRLHFGEPLGLHLNQEASGNFPSPERARTWTAGNRANLCIGQGEMDVTPLQLAVMTCALANGGRVLQPRLVQRLESQSPVLSEPAVNFPGGEVRDTLGVSPRSLEILHKDMLAETEDAQEGTGRDARVAGLRICGKTGTAARMEHGVKRNTTWFISFAPYEHPKYAVVVAVEDGVSGGHSCAPVARKIYEALLLRERGSSAGTAPLALAH